MKKDFFEEFSNISDNIFVVADINGQVEYANDVFCNTIQTKREELIGKNLKNFFTESEKREADELINNLKAGTLNDEEHFITEVITKNGEKRTIQGKNSYIKDEDGNFRYVVTSGEDITEYKKILSEKNIIIQELKKSQEELNLSLRNGLTVLWEWDQKNDKLTISADYKKLGISFKDIENLTLSSWLNKIHEDDRLEITKKINVFISKKLELFENEYRIKKDDGKYIWIISRAKAIKNEEEDTIKIVGTFTDNTNRKIIEKMFEKKQNLMNMLNEYNEYIMSENDEDKLLNNTAEMIRKMGDFKYSVIQYINESDEKTFEIKTEIGLDKNFFNDYILSWDKNSDDLVSLGASINSGKTEIFKHGETNLKLWNIASKEFGFKSSISIPIKVYGKIIGALGVYFEDKNEFSHDMIRFLEQMVISLNLSVERIRKEKELKKEKFQHRSLLNLLTDFVVTMDKDLTVKWANKAALEGIPNIIGKKCHKALINSDIPCDNCVSLKAFQTGKPEKSIMKMPVLVDGVEKEIYWDNSVIPIKNEKGEVVKIVEVSRNITELIEIQEREEHLLNVLRAIKQVQKIIIEEKNKEDLLKNITKTLLKAREYYDCWVILYDKNMNPEFCYQANEEEKFKDICENALEGKYTECVDKAVEEKELIKIVDPNNECKECFASDFYKGQSAFIIPIKYNHRIFGVLYLSVDKIFVKDKEEEKLLMDISDEIGFALNAIEEKKKLIESEEQRILAFNKIKSNQEIFIQSLGKVVEMRDPYTSGHQRRVAELAIEIGKNMNLSEERADAVRIASLLHDIGKIYIPTEILNKAGKLSNIEFEMIKEHSQFGYELLKGLEFDFPVPKFVLQHHERIDGSGYPNGLKEDEIYLESKIIAVADVVEAISSHRPYRPALGLDVALEEIKNNSGKLYDTEVVEACLKAFEKGFEFKEQ